MSQSDRRDAGSLPLKVVTATLLVIAIIENGCLYWILTWNLAFSIFVAIPTVLGLSYLLFLWLCFRLVDAKWALLGSAVAAAAAPWTLLLLLLQAPRIPDQERMTIEIAGWFGPLIPYAVLAAVGLWKRR